MTNLKAFEPIVDLIDRESRSDSGLSARLIRCHNLIAHSAPVDEWDEDTQCDLYMLWVLIDKIRQTEKAINQGEVK